MSDSLPDGVYEDLLTRRLRRAVAALHLRGVSERRVSDDEAPQLLARAVGAEVQRVLEEIRGEEAGPERVALCNDLLGRLRRDSAATSSTRRPQGLRDIRDAVLRLAGGQGRAKRGARRADSLTAEDRGARELRVAFGTDLVQGLRPLRGELRSPWTSPVPSAPALL